MPYPHGFKLPPISVPKGYILQPSIPEPIPRRTGEASPTKRKANRQGGRTTALNYLDEELSEGELERAHIPATLPVFTPGRMIAKTAKSRFAGSTKGQGRLAF